MTTAVAGASDDGDSKEDDNHDLLPTDLRRHFVMERRRAGCPYRKIADMAEEEFGSEKLPNSWGPRYVYKDVQRYLSQRDQATTRHLKREAEYRMPTLCFLEEKLKEQLEETEDPHATAKLADSLRGVLDDQIESIRHMDEAVETPREGNDNEDDDSYTGIKVPLNLEQRKQVRHFLEKYGLVEDKVNKDKPGPEDSGDAEEQSNPDHEENEIERRPFRKEDWEEEP